MTTTSSHPQAAEVARLLAHLIANGFSLHSVDDGGDTYKRPTVDEAAGHILGVDDSTLYVTHPSAPSKAAPERPAILAISIVLGNGPGELASDYADREPLDSCLTAWADAEEERATAEHRAEHLGREADYRPRS